MTATGWERMILELRVAMAKAGHTPDHLQRRLLACGLTITTSRGRGVTGIQDIGDKER